jgi:hypothetical protein
MKWVRDAGGGIAGRTGVTVYAFRDFFGQNLTESGINPAVARAEDLRQYRDYEQSRCVCDVQQLCQ